MALADNLEGYWPVDETDESGNGRDMTPVNAPGTGTGHVNATVGDYEKGDVSYLDYTTDTTFEFGDVDVSWNCWMNRESSYGSLFAHYVSSSDRSYLIYHYGSGLQFIAKGASGGAAVATIASGGPTTGTWYMVTAYHDASGDEIGIAVDGGSFTTTAHTYGLNAACTGNFRIAGTQLSGYSWDGLLEEAAVWTRVIDSGDVGDLWNSGSGATIPTGGGGGVSIPVVQHHRLRLQGCEFRTSEREIERVRRRLEFAGLSRRHMRPEHFGLRWDVRRGCLWAPAREIVLPSTHDVPGVPRLLLPKTAPTGRAA